MDEEGQEETGRAEVGLSAQGVRAAVMADVRPSKKDDTVALRGKLRALLSVVIGDLVTADYASMKPGERIRLAELLAKHGLTQAGDADPAKGIPTRGVVFLPPLHTDASE